MSPKFRYLLMKCLDEVIYDVDDQGVGFMPILVQVMHNNYTDGIKSIGFKLDQKTGAFFLLIKEGNVTHEIKCGFDGHRAITDIDEHGEIYSISTVSEFSIDEYGRPVLRNEFYLLEDSTARVMNIYLGKREPLEHDSSFAFGKVKPPVNIGVRFDEIPGSGMLIGILNQFGHLDVAKGMSGFVMNKLSDYGAIDALMLAIRDTVRPKLHGVIHDKESVVEYDSNDGVPLPEIKANTNELDAIMEDD